MTTHADVLPTLLSRLAPPGASPIELAGVDGRDVLAADFRRDAVMAAVERTRAIVTDDRGMRIAISFPTDGGVRFEGVADEYGIVYPHECPDPSTWPTWSHRVAAILNNQAGRAGIVINPEP